MVSSLKVAVVVLNTLALFLGLASLVVGVWAYVDRDEALQLAKVSEDENYDDIDQPGLLQVVAGAAVTTGVGLLVMATLGLCGVGKDSKCLLALGTGLLVLFILLQVCVIALASVTLMRVRDHLKPGLLAGIRDQYEGHINSGNLFSDSLDNVQVKLDCCGVDNYTDFQTSTTWADRTSLQVPKACCKIDKDQYINNKVYVFLDTVECAQFPNSNNTNIDKACYEDVQSWVDETVYALLVVSVLVAFAELLCLLCACCLIRNMKAQSKFYED